MKITIAMALVLVCGCARTEVKPTAYTGREATMFGFAQRAAASGEHFFYVRIPGNIGPAERGERFEAPLLAALAKSAVGRVTGGGSQLGEGKTIEFCGIDVVVKKQAEGLEIVRRVLRQANAPAATVIEEYLPRRVDHPL